MKKKTPVRKIITLEVDTTFSLATFSRDRLQKALNDAFVPNDPEYGEVLVVRQVTKQKA